MKKSIALLFAFCIVVVAGQAATFTVISTNETWRYAKGITEASSPNTAAWRSNAFNDVNFSNAPAPFWYGDVLPGGTQITDMMNSYLCIFLRKQFVLTNYSAVVGLQLGALVDDGFVAWINGAEVLRVNPPTPEPFTIASSVAAAATEPVQFTLYDLPLPAGYVTGPTNVLTVQVFNAGLASSDLGFDASLVASLDDVPPVVSGQSPFAGATVLTLSAIQVNFSEAVTGVSAGDLLINGVAATNLINVSPSIYTFEFPQPPTGVVSVAFASLPGIADTFGNLLTTNTWSYVLNPNAVLSSVFISEFLASNNGNGTNALRDEDGDASDWIELRNPAATPANIGGWYLTDAADNLTKWRIPSGASVPANGYMIVFASGKNRTNNLARLHANFQLAAGGEYLALVDAGTNIVSQFAPTFPAQSLNVSYGRDQAAPSILGYFAVPSPGAANTTGADPLLDVQFSRTGGTFAGTFQLSLTSAVPNAVIRYTIINSAQNVTTATNIPSPASTLYTGPITVSSSVQVRARAFPASPTSFPGAPRTELYFQIDAGITNFVSTLPIVIIHMVANSGLSGGYPSFDNSVMITCLDNNTPSKLASIMDPPQMIKRAGLNLRGSSTQTFPKSSYAIEFWDEYNSDDEASFAGLPQESDWVLYAPNQFDLSMMHNPIMHQLGRDFGYYSSRTRYVEVFFRNNTGAITASTNATSTAMGDYNGVYVLEEKVKRDGNRVDIDVLQPEQTNAVTISGGYLLKVDRTDGNERTFAGGGMTINYQEPDGLEMVTPARAAQAAYIKGYLDNMNTGLTGNALTNIASTNHYSNYLDVDATIDLHIGNVMVMNADGYRLSGYMYKPRGGKLVAGPLWDVDRGLGTSRGDARTYNPRSWQSFDADCGAGTDYGTDFFGGSGVNTWLWLTRWFSDVDFWQRWIDRYQEKRTSSLDTNRLAEIVDGFAAEVREAQVREQKRWTGGGASDTSPRSGVVANCTGIFTHTFPTPGTYQGEVNFQKRWLLEHVNFIDTNLLNRPTLSVPEGLVPLGATVTLNDRSGKAGTALYYTLDGSDPRGFQGTTNPAALRYTAPITISGNVRLRARAINPNHRNLTGTTASGPSGTRNPIVTTPWSGDIAATYFITPPPLVITELMYHPAPPTSQSDTNDADNFEYLELKNVGSNVLNLVGFRFTNGIDFTFTATNNVTSLPPGGLVLIVKNITSFILRYGAQPNIAGQFGGNLDNSGERLTLVGPRLEPVLDFTYSDAWYPLSDGLGFSLVIRDENAPLSSWGDQGSWRVSSTEGGSPGLPNPPAPDLPLVLINEALTHTDLPAVDTIELFNPGPNPAAIGGWYLTDDLNEPKKFLIPADTTVPAGGYLLFDEDQFNLGGNNFALSSEGDELYLFSATNGLLSGYAHGFDFGAAQNGVTFGRHVTSQGDEDFVAQSLNTLGADNALPLVGPVVISEIMYHPPDTLTGTNLVDNALDEFIELLNITSTNVPLFHATHQTNTWQITQAVSFAFPTNVTLAPLSFVLVVNFNPDTNAAQLAAFRARYGVSNSVPIFGPYGGKLDNSSANLRLSRPDNPGTNGTIPYILVDRVEYADSGAWPPTADGAGPSLHRLVVGDYGNDPTNWTAALASPGSGFAGGTLPAITQQPAPATVFVAGSVATSPLYQVGTTSFVAAATGPGLRYQWRFNNTTLPGATNATLVLTNLQFTDAGHYSVLAYNSAGTVLSSNALLSVYAPLAILVHPVSQNVPAGATVSLGITAIGVGPLRYQWRFEGADLAGATNLIYTFSNANLTLNGNYSCQVQDEFSSLVSSNAFIYAPPVYFTLQPSSQNVLPGTNVTIQALALGFGPVRYQWQYEEVDIPGATNTSYSFTNAQLISHGNYRVIATDSQGSGTSSNAFIFVLIRPGIVSNPVAQTVLQGRTAVFSIIATGAPPLYYRWLRNGSLWVSNASPDLVITNCQSNGTFRVTVVNVAGSAASVPAGGVALNVLRDFDGDGQADIWETNYPGFSTNNAADALLDFDGDGMINRDEFVAGTNPTNALSLLNIILSTTNTSALQFVAQTNIGYTVQWRTNLSSALWTTLSNITASPQVRTMAVDAASPPGVGERYYRIVTPLVP